MKFLIFFIALMLSSCNYSTIKYNKTYYYFEKNNRFRNYYFIRFLNDSFFVVNTKYNPFHLSRSICNKGHWVINKKKVILTPLPCSDRIEILDYKTSEHKEKVVTTLFFQDSFNEVSPYFQCFSNGKKLDVFFMDYGGYNKMKELPYEIDSLYLIKIYRNIIYPNEDVRTESKILVINKSDTVFVATKIDTCNDSPIFKNIEIPIKKLLKTRLEPVSLKIQFKGL